ncbi:DUF2213 domain-containing protein [Inquilinus sp.]|uniref:DUF2213 domain-containing protein n=1 Tax=Inquilinus sp. TaxID=1932117 RepID=UPI0031D899BB
MLITDTVTLVGDQRTTADGYLVASARIARTGVQQYLGSEMGRPDLSVVRVYRPADEVFAADALSSMAHRPVTLDHPSEPVTSANWKALSIGQVGGEVARDGEFVRVPLVLMDQGAIDAVQAGKRQLSVGYVAQIDWTAGTTDAGEPYDAIQRGIRANHLAVVDAARAGPACRIGDSWSTPKPERTDMTKQVKIDGITVELSDTAYEVVSKLMSDHQTLKDVKAKVDADLATAQTGLQTKDGEITGLKAQLADAQITPAKLDAAVAARAAVIADARKIAGDKLVVDGKTEAEIRRAAVAAKIGDAAAKDLADAAVEGAFRVLVPAGQGGAGQARQDPLRAALADQQPGGGDQREAAWQARQKRIGDAWKGEAAKA